MNTVLGRSQGLVASIVDIAASTREQSSASQEIAQNVERISAMAQSNRRGAAGVRFGGAIARAVRQSGKPGQLKL
jgi:methyl-accepting chemotaxis protein/methyl-accepting chemotaxis protein-2 (aspartate sensor receptor)